MMVSFGLGRVAGGWERRRRRRWRSCGFKLVVALLHLVEEGDVTVALKLLVIVEVIVVIIFVGDEFFHFRFVFLIIRFQVHLINAESASFSHGCHVLTKEVLRKA